MKFKPNKEKIIYAIILIIICLYLTWLPAEIVEYGLEHNKTEWGFNLHGSTPFYEAYSVFLIFFWAIHFGVVVILYGIYWVIKKLFFIKREEIK